MEYQCWKECMRDLSSVASLQGVSEGPSGAVAAVGCCRSRIGSRNWAANVRYHILILIL